MITSLLASLIHEGSHYKCFFTPHKDSTVSRLGHSKPPNVKQETPGQCVGTIVVMQLIHYYQGLTTQRIAFVMNVWYYYKWKPLRREQIP